MNSLRLWRSKKVVGMAKISRRGFFKTALAMGAMPLVANEEKKSETLKFIHITDSHMDLTDADSVEAMELMASFINENYKDLDFVLFGGDNFNNNASADSDALKFKQIIETLHCPALVVRGNKESSPKGDAQIGQKEFIKMFVNGKGLKVFGKDWLLQTKGYNILGLDSCIDNQNNGLYTNDTLSFAQMTLMNKKPTVILNHHPYTNYWKSTDKKDIQKYVLGNTKQTQEKLFQYDNLILTLSGHKHIDSVTKIKNTTTIVTRGFIRPLDLDMYPMRYIEITDGKISEKLIYTA
jgi:Icc protein